MKKQAKAPRRPSKGFGTAKKGGGLGVVFFGEQGAGLGVLQSISFY